MKLFNSDEMKLAVLYCLEKGYRKKLWKAVKKIIKRPSFIYFTYIVTQIKKSSLYPKLSIKIKIYRSKKFYIMLFKNMIKYDYEIKNRLPITNEKIKDIIKKWKIPHKLVYKFTDKYKLQLNYDHQINNKLGKIDVNINDNIDYYIFIYIILTLLHTIIYFSYLYYL
jgi:hypothetical protein